MALAFFRAQKSLDFQGPSFPMAIEMDFPQQNHYVPRYTYKQQVYTYIDSYFLMTLMLGDVFAHTFQGLAWSEA